MARPIKETPILKGEDARLFLKRVESLEKATLVELERITESFNKLNNMALPTSHIPDISGEASRRFNEALKNRWHVSEEDRKEMMDLVDKVIEKSKLHTGSRGWVCPNCGCGMSPSATRCPCADPRPRITC